MKHVLLLLAFCCLASAQALTIFALPDVTMTGSAVRLSATGSARMCQLVGASANNVAGVRWGDSTVTTSRGASIAPGSGQFIPPAPAPSPGGGSFTFSLSSVYLIGTSGDVVRVTCWR